MGGSASSCPASVQGDGFADAIETQLTAYIQSVLERNVARTSREEVLRRVGAELLRMDRGPLPGDE